MILSDFIKERIYWHRLETDIKDYEIKINKEIEKCESNIKKEIFNLFKKNNIKNCEVNLGKYNKYFKLSSILYNFKKSSDKLLMCGLYEDKFKFWLNNINYNYIGNKYNDDEEDEINDKILSYNKKNLLQQDNKNVAENLSDLVIPDEFVNKFKNIDLYI